MNPYTKTHDPRFILSGVIAQRATDLAESLYIGCTRCDGKRGVDNQTDAGGRGSCNKSSTAAWHSSGSGNE
ncbi:hypothetical protein J6590_061564 [Homalodisca vitripennis]|nr:hypothetical protein J6590_061564 [Homalodisca vitripennis]